MVTYHDNRQKLPHPILLEARQIAPNQILINYDQRTDLASATNISNYWIRSIAKVWKWLDSVPFKETTPVLKSK